MGDSVRPVRNLPILRGCRGSKPEGESAKGKDCPQWTRLLLVWCTLKFLVHRFSLQSVDFERVQSGFNFRFEIFEFLFADNLAVEEMHLALRVTCKAWIMRDHADGRALAVQVGQQVHDCFAIL